MAIHDLLPPTTLDPPPLILANQDLNGFNDGVTLSRVSHQLVSFLSQVIVASHSLTSQWHLGTGGEGPPSDQRAISLVILGDNDFREGFYEIPMTWLNAYTIPIETEETIENDDLQGQVHLVNREKYDWEFEGIIGLADEVYRRAQERAWTEGREGNGLDLMEKREKVREAATAWWSHAKNGIEAMVFSGT